MERKVTSFVHKIQFQDPTIKIVHRNRRPENQYPLVFVYDYSISGTFDVSIFTRSLEKDSDGAELNSENHEHINNLDQATIEHHHSQLSDSLTATVQTNTNERRSEASRCYSTVTAGPKNRQPDTRRLLLNLIICRSFDSPERAQRAMWISIMFTDVFSQVDG